MKSIERLKKSSIDNPILFYDGACVLCNRYVKWLLMHDSREHFRIAMLQDFPHLVHTLPADDNDTVVLMKDGKVYTHSDVGILIMKELGGLWTLLYLFYFIPKFIRDSIYRWIAKNRYRWFGQYDTCLLPDPQKEHIFIKP